MLYSSLAQVIHFNSEMRMSMAAKMYDFLLLNNLLLVVKFYVDILSNEEGRNNFPGLALSNFSKLNLRENSRKIRVFANL